MLAPRANFAMTVSSMRLERHDYDSVLIADDNVAGGRMFTPPTTIGNRRSPASLAGNWGDADAEARQADGR